MKKALQVASVASMIDQFTMPNINILQELGYEVDVAANFEFGSTSSEERVKEFQKELKTLDVNVFNLLFNRKIFDKCNIRVYKQLKEIIEENNYQVIHCHSPIGGVITRLAARKSRKKGTKVIYTAHGFHFFKGAPLINWLLYYPIEWICSWFTDVLITINQEDYKLAKNKMKAKETCYVPGVGIDTKKFTDIQVDRRVKRRELGLPENTVLLLSVGELNKNKNHEVIIKALAKLDNPNIHYCIVGKGELLEYLKQLANSLGILDKVHFLGFRRDVGMICKSADIFCFPSKREGLGLAALEGMASGLPLITSNVHGINDYSKDGVTGFTCDPEEIDEFINTIDRLIKDDSLREEIKKNNIEHAKRFDISLVNENIKKIYKNCI